MSTFKSKIITVTLLSSALFLSACNQKNTNKTEVSATDQVIEELSSQPIKQFAKTNNDIHDIKILIDYDARYTAVSETLEDELQKMKENSNLTAQFAYERKHDSILSALDMLKQLDLKTEQGRFIQGLLATYWETQEKLLEEQKDHANQTPNVTIDQGDAIQSDLQAQQQLEYWRAQYPELDAQ